MLVIGIAVNVAIQNHLIYEGEKTKFVNNTNGIASDFPSRFVWSHLPHKTIDINLLRKHLLKVNRNRNPKYNDVTIDIGPVNLVVDYTTMDSVKNVRGINWFIGSFGVATKIKTEDYVVSYIGDGYFFTGSFEDYEEDLLVMRLCFET